jgi:16S rRNA processing protein RimM
LGDKRILVGKFGAAQGVRGEVRLFAFLDDPGSLKRLGVLEDKEGAKKFKILSSRPAKDFLVVKVEGVEDRDAAGKLTHIELFVPRERLPEQKDKNSFYHFDLIGLRAEDNAGKTLGSVVAVQNFGAGDLLEIKPADGGEAFLLPFAHHFVPVVDVERGRVVVDLPENFFDPGENEEALSGDAR